MRSQLYIEALFAITCPVMKNSKISSSQTFYGVILPILSFACLAGSLAYAQAPAPDSPAIEAQAHAMIAKLTVEQKVELLGGIENMFTRTMPVIDLPRFKMSDASVGVRTWGPTTAYPSGASLAATWDTDLARKVGEAVGRDARARGVNFLLGPGVNISRSPLAGRNFEYLSEDPYLNATLVVPYIEGVQSQGVVATVKHYALNNQEYNRHNASADIDERTMREIYLPAFEAAVTRAHVDAVMNSYNLVNGVHATQNDFLNLKVLKGEWKFQGVLMSDWDATYDGVAACNNGLDLEMPSPKFMNAKNLLPAVQNGQVKESTIDEHLQRLFRTELRYGFTTRPQFDPTQSTYSVADRPLALQEALESITLLKNQGNLLPLDAGKIKTIVIIGPNAWPAVTGGGGSSHATPFEPISLVTGVANLVGPDVHVLYSGGLPEMTDVFKNTHWENGVKVDTFASADFTGTPQTGTRRNVNDYRADQWEAVDPNPRTIRYTASFKANQPGKYMLVAAASGEDSFKIFADGNQLIEQGHAEGQLPQSATLDLAAGQVINIQADYLPRAAGSRFGFGVIAAADLVTPDEKNMAALADIAIVAIGFNDKLEGEGHDRTFLLPPGQDALVEQVAAANPHTIVVTNAGGGFDTTRWLDKVPVLLDTYYSGQEGGTAVAQILFGRHDPEGKLPVSFDRTWEENPSAKWYRGDPADNTTLHTIGENGEPKDYTVEHIKYGDKLMVGYRYWTTTGKHPLFPFGFGLSYTTFSFSHLEVPASAPSGSTVPVSFDVTNTGSLAGAEVAQLYVSDPSAKADRPERELKGFAKVRLDPGQRQHVTLSLDARAFSYWSEAAHNWTIDPGKFVVRVGDSSENTPLTADIDLR
jgi:beta-glucosidase